MGEVSLTLTQRWQAGDHVGPARPVCSVQIRGGRFQKGYGPHEMLDGSFAEFAYFPETPRDEPWHYTWEPAGDWVDLPNVAEVTREKDFDANGVQRATIAVDNVTLVEQSGLSGLYHAVERGWLAPFRGYNPPDRPGTNITTNEWYQLLAQNAQVRVYEGYGDAVSCVFNGLLDDIELESFPDKITLQARDFGQVLVDQRFMGHVKDRHVKDPVIFADRRWADKTTKSGGSASASSAAPGHPARLAMDEDKTTAWISEAGSIGDIEWIQFKVPQGRYEDLYVESEYEGLEMYVSIHATDLRDGRHPIVNGEQMDDEGWVDLGRGNVPGGGHSIVRHINSITKKGRSYRLNAVISMGDDSLFRVYFTNLKKDNDIGGFHAGVRHLQAVKRKQKEDVAEKRWILVDDAAEVVKCCLRWAGFQEWEVESTGVRLTDKRIFNRSDFLIDAIKWVGELTNYVFFMGDPSSHPDSRGVPIFRSNRAMEPAGFELLPITDAETLTGIKARFTDEPLARVIRVRGKLVDQDEGGKRDFVGTGADTWAAYQAFYIPPWGRFDDRHRLGGLIKHVVHVDQFLESHLECHIAARFIAAAEALASATATLEIAGYPGLDLDQQVWLHDRATGLASRLWIASRSSSFSRGETTKYTTSIGGALIDIPDLVSIRAELSRLVRDSDEEEPINP